MEGEESEGKEEPLKGYCLFETCNLVHDDGTMLLHNGRYPFVNLVE